MFCYHLSTGVTIISQAIISANADTYILNDDNTVTPITNVSFDPSEVVLSYEIELDIED